VGALGSATSVERKVSGLKVLMMRLLGG